MAFASVREDVARAGARVSWDVRAIDERTMAELTFTYGTMAAGKSTLALQLCWQLRQGRSDVALWTFGDRSDDGMVTSRIGIEATRRSRRARQRSRAAHRTTACATASTSW